MARKCDPNRALFSGKRTPPVALLARWADALDLRGKVREEFMLAGWLEHAPKELRAYVMRLRRRYR